MTPYLIYILSVAINLKVISIFIMAVSTTIFIFNAIDDYAFSDRLRSFLTIKRLICTILVSGFIICAVPSERQMYLIAGTYIAEKNYDSVVNSPEFDKSRKIIQMHLDKYIEDLAKEAEESNTKNK